MRFDAVKTLRSILIALALIAFAVNFFVRVNVRDPVTGVSHDDAGIIWWWLFWR